MQKKQNQVAKEESDGRTAKEEVGIRVTDGGVGDVRWHLERHFPDTVFLNQRTPYNRWPTFFKEDEYGKSYCVPKNIESIAFLISISNINKKEQ